MPAAPGLPLPPALLATALACFTQHGLRTTSTERMAVAAGLSHGSFYRLISSKDQLLEAVYTFALGQLAAPLTAGGGAAQLGEGLHEQLARWWQLLADAAQAHPQAFAFWRLYRTNWYPLASGSPDLGPFLPFLAHVGPVLAARPTGAPPAFSSTLLAELLAAQWLAAVEVTLTNPGCRAQPALRARVLAQTYAGWWQATGLPADTPALAYEPS